jgi:hypothetical protein
MRIYEKKSSDISSATTTADIYANEKGVMIIQQKVTGPNSNVIVLSFEELESLIISFQMKKQEVLNG